MFQPQTLTLFDQHTNTKYNSEVDGKFVQVTL